MAGICGTDLQILEGYAGSPASPAMSSSAWSESAPPRDAHWIGKRVVGEINVGCGRCEWCRRNVKEHCTNRSVVGIRSGAVRSRSPGAAGRQPASGAGAIDDQAAVFVEPVGRGVPDLRADGVAPESRVAIVGDGRMGLLVAQVVRTVAPR